MALFQQNSGSGSGSKNLVEFKCGKMTLSGTTVTADKRKGLLYIYRFAYNSLYRINYTVSVMSHINILGMIVPIFVGKIVLLVR